MKKQKSWKIQKTKKIVKSRWVTIIWIYINAISREKCKYSKHVKYSWKCDSTTLIYYDFMKKWPEFQNTKKYVKMRRQCFDLQRFHEKITENSKHEKTPWKCDGNTLLDLLLLTTISREKLGKFKTRKNSWKHNGFVLFDWNPL